MSRLRFIVGKGGVGRTTTTIGMGLALARAGRRTLVIELNGVHDIGRRFGVRSSYEPVEIATDLFWASLTPHGCMQDFGRRKMHLGIFGARLMASRPLQAFVDAIPGLPDLLQLGKIENLLNEPEVGDPVFDTVIVDAPATGHGLSLLRAPEALTEISESGPFHDLAHTIARALSDVDTGVVVVTLAERLPYSETIALLDALHESSMHPARIVVNKVVHCPIPEIQQWESVRSGLLASRQPDLARLTELTETLIAVKGEQREVIDLLRARAAHQQLPLTEVPLLASRSDHEAVAVALEGT